MRITPAVVAEEHEWVRSRDSVVGIVNDLRNGLGEAFGTDVDSITTDMYRDEVDAVFAEGDRAVNVAALVGLLRDLDVSEDYPGFVVDELLGRELAATIAGGQPRSLLAQATFHVADVTTDDGSDASAGADDLDAALAAGVQTRLPGWDWTAGESPFAVEHEG